MKLALPFLAGYLLDLCLGDPPGWPHPVKALGRVITFLEARLYRPTLLAGLVFWLAVAGSSLVAVLAALALAAGLGPLVLWGGGGVSGLCRLGHPQSPPGKPPRRRGPRAG